MRGLVGRNRNFRLLLIGHSISVLGDPLLPFALAYSALRTGDGRQFGWLLAARSAGALVFTLIGGALADERRQNRVMAACDAVRLVLVLSIGLALFVGSTPVTALLVFAFSSVGAFFGPAMSAALPRLVGADELQLANGLLTGAKRVGALAGPALGVFFIETVGVGGTLAVDAATFAVSSGCLALMRMDPVKAKPGQRLVRKVQEGVAAVRNHRWLTILISLGLVQVAFCLVPWLALLPVVMSGQRHATITYAACLAAFAAGSVAGSLVAMRARPRFPGTLSQLAMCPFALMLLALGLGLPAWIMLGLHFIAGAGVDLYGVLFITAVQRGVDRELIGRVMALDSVGSTALSPFAFAVFGLLGQSLDPRVVLFWGGLIGVAIALLPLFDPQIRAYSTDTGAGSRVELQMS